MDDDFEKVVVLVKLPGDGMKPVKPGFARKVTLENLELFDDGRINCQIVIRDVQEGG